MRYARRSLISLFAILLLTGAFAAVSSAQTRSGRVIYRPVIVRTPIYVRDPFWTSRWYDPWYDPYFHDPYLRDRRERYYKQKAVIDARRKLAKDREKYASDGIITAEEREKLDKRARKLNEAIAKLNKFNREHPAY